MFRKTIAVVVAALLSLAILPSLAIAAPTGSAALVTGADVFPGAGRSFSVQVNNNGLMLVGESINWVSIILPNNQGITTTSGVAAPSGWEVKTVNTSTVQNYTFTTASSRIGPNSSLAFPFPANVAAPAADKAGDFRVFVSSDGGQTTSRADGALTSVIRTLEIQSFGITAPAGAADGTATSGQAVTFTAPVRNYASGAQSVTAATEGGSRTVSIPAGATSNITIPVTLATVSQDGTRRYNVTATAPSSEAVGRFADIGLQLAPRLTLVPQSFAPNRVRSNAPINYTFTVGATKRNTPNLTVNSCQLVFDANGTPNTFDLGTPASWTANNQQTLSFAPGSVSGPTGQYTANVNCSGTDGNGAAFTQVPLDGNLSLNIDNLAPAITNLEVLLPSGQSAVKNTDEVDVEWDMDDTGASFTTTEVRDNRGNVVPITDITRSGNHYTGTAIIDFPQDVGTVFAQVEAIDFEGGNPGGAASELIDLDNVIPYVLDPARTTSPSTIEVYIADNTTVSGGCQSSHWSVANNIVTAVGGGANDTVCGDSNYRTLTLLQPIATDATPSVTYNQMALGVQQNPIRDGAANRAATATIDTVVGILPGAPNLVDVTRNGGTEAAVFDADAYWTRFTGNDLQVSFTGANPGYQAYIVDGSGRDVAGPIALAGDTDIVNVPIGSTDGTYARGIQLVNAAGRGEITYLTVALDRVSPALTGAVANGNAVTANFNDVVWAGDNFASSWYGYENTSEGLAAYQPARVDIAGGDMTSRLLTFEFDTPANAANVADYLLASANRYQDRAGNTLADTLS